MGFSKAPEPVPPYPISRFPTLGGWKNIEKVKKIKENLWKTKEKRGLANLSAITSFLLAAPGQSSLFLIIFKEKLGFHQIFHNFW